jgi:hypothetical protein
VVINQALASARQVLQDAATSGELLDGNWVAARMASGVSGQSVAW